MQKENRCFECGKLFIPSLRHPNQKACSKKCCKKLNYKTNKLELLKKCKERYNKIKNTSEYKEKQRITMQNWRKLNPEKNRAASVRSYTRNREKILARLRKYELKERICLFCGKKFMPDSSHPLAKCCSQNCRCRLWEKNHPERYTQLSIEKHKLYRQRHPERIKEYTRKLVESGRANINAKEWARKNPEKLKAIKRRTYQKNKPKRLAEAKASTYRRRAILKKQIFEFGKKEIYHIQHRDGDTCVYCHKKLNESEVHFDHIIPLRGKGKYGENSILNIVISCGNCNLRKHNKELEEWFKTDYCINRNISKNTINPIVFELLKKQKEQKKITE